MSKTTKLSEVVTASLSRPTNNKAANYQKRLVPWSEFEPLLNRLRQAMPNTSTENVMRAMGYAGLVGEWRQRGVPQVAKMAARGLLADLDVPAPKPEVPRQFTFDELGQIFTALLTAEVLQPQARAALQVKIAAEMSRYI